MKDSYWEPVKDQKAQKDDIIKLLTKSNVSMDIATEVASQLSLVEEDNNNIIFIFSDENEYVVTGIHVPAESINGETGPVLMRGGNDKSIIAAFSRDFIVEKLEKVDLKEEKAGLRGIADVEWVNELENLAELVRIELRANPPASWDDLLAGE